MLQIKGAYMRSLIFIISFLILSISVCKADTTDDINQFFLLLKSDKPPSITDYYIFFGSGAEGELELAFKICKLKGWVPINDNQQCLDFMSERHKFAKKTPSLYFAWLKSIFPKPPYNIKINSIVNIRNEGVLKHDLATVDIDGTIVEFFRPSNQADASQFGKLSVTKINETPISSLFNDYKEHITD